jgi:hypothetical protein
MRWEIKWGLGCVFHPSDQPIKVIAGVEPPGRHVRQQVKHFVKTRSRRVPIRVDIEDIFSIKAIDRRSLLQCGTERTFVFPREEQAVGIPLEEMLSGAPHHIDSEV